eukprot:853411_1
MFILNVIIRRILLTIYGILARMDMILMDMILIQKMKNRRWNKYNELEDKEDIVFVDEDSDDEGEPGDGNVAAASNTNSKRGTKRQRGSDVIVTEPPRKKAKKAHNKKKQQNKKKNKPKPSSTLQISDGFSFL